MDKCITEFDSTKSDIRGQDDDTQKKEPACLTFSLAWSCFFTKSLSNFFLCVLVCASTVDEKHSCVPTSPLARKKHLKCKNSLWTHKRKQNSAQVPRTLSTVFYSSAVQCGKCTCTSASKSQNCIHFTKIWWAKVTKAVPTRNLVNSLDMSQDKQVGNQIAPVTSSNLKSNVNEHCSCVWWQWVPQNMKEILKWSSCDEKGGALLALALQHLLHFLLIVLSSGPKVC